VQLFTEISARFRTTKSGVSIHIPEYKAESLTHTHTQKKPSRPAFHFSSFLLHFNINHYATDGAIAIVLNLSERLEDDLVTVKNQELLLGAAE